MTAERRELILTLLVASLKCLKVWRVCLDELKTSSSAIGDDEAKKLVVETVRKILAGSSNESGSSSSSFDNFNVRFALDIGPRYLPSKDALINLKENSNEEIIRTLAQDALELFSQVFENKSADSSEPNAILNGVDQSNNLGTILTISEILF